MALDYLSSMNRMFRTKTAINLKATGTTIIIPAQPRRFLAGSHVYVAVQTKTGTVGTLPQFSIGSDASNYQNVAGDSVGIVTVPDTAGVNFVYPFKILDVTDVEQYLQYADLTTSGLRVNVQVASTQSGVHTAHIFVEGAIF
jgi:hypothetical protein